MQPSSVCVDQTVLDITDGNFMYVKNNSVMHVYEIEKCYILTTMDCVIVASGVGVAPQRAVSKSPTILPIAPQTSLSNRSSTASVVSSKGTAAVAPQPICMSKPQQQQQQQQQLAQNSTSVLSQLGMTVGFISLGFNVVGKELSFNFTHCAM